ncbi:hypothetical protein [Natranaerobius thermophilus]|uniref:Uncharacterized protein n=1 Tax=Natranaerobius thermophilus (strain ATCC BAA-1301 / DSM 18059 / JW/NM-WN-LF) TaxID=457570 RepID=B2A6F7_NATTJ|nr:hypothetical protein [Natranaerobius thermophilus]ACB85490.1 hypothetical protein Nther_1919 [Natranaerobius thermophilus JW/NM-WN-LF]
MQLIKKLTQSSIFNIILLGLVIISLIAVYVIYQDLKEAEGVIASRVNNNLNDSIINLDQVVQNGQFALVTGDRDNQNKYLNKMDERAKEFETSIRDIPYYHTFNQEFGLIRREIDRLVYNTMLLTDWIEDEDLSGERKQLFNQVLEEYHELKEMFINLSESYSDGDQEQVDNLIDNLAERIEKDLYDYHYIKSKKDDEYEEKLQAEKEQIEEALSSSELEEQKKDKAKRLAEKHLQGQIDLKNYEYHGLNLIGGPRPQQYKIRYKNNSNKLELTLNVNDEVLAHRLEDTQTEEEQESMADKKDKEKNDKFEKDKAMAKAKQFLENNVSLSPQNLNLEGLKKDEDKLLVLYRKTIDGKLIQTATVSITISLSDGTIEGFNAYSLATEDIQEVENTLMELEKNYTDQEAKERLNPENELVGDGQLVFGYSDSLYWRFPVMRNDEHYYILIDASTGEEYSISKMDYFQVNGLKYRTKSNNF